LHEGPVLATSDGGYSWEAVGPGDHYSWHITFKNANEVFLTGWNSNTYETLLKKSNDGGYTWNTFTLGEYGHGYHMAFADENLAFIAVLDPVILKSINGGDSWYEVPINTFDNMGIYSFSFPSSEIGYAANSRKLMKTTDSGETWEEVSVFPMNASYSNIIHFFAEDVGWMAGYKGLLKKVTSSTPQYNPVVNFDLDTSYIQGTTQFSLSWDVPDTTNSAHLSGFNIYRNDTLLTSVAADVFTYSESLPHWQGFDEICYYVTAGYINPVGESLPTEKLCGDFLTGIHEQQTANEQFCLTCFPNPGDGNIIISFEFPEQHKNGTISIWDSNGNHVLSVLVDSRKTKVVVCEEDLKPGIYFYQLKTGGGVSGIKKMIKI